MAFFRRNAFPISKPLHPRGHQTGAFLVKIDCDQCRTTQRCQLPICVTYDAARKVQMAPIVWKHFRRIREFRISDDVVCTHVLPRYFVSGSDIQGHGRRIRKLDSSSSRWLNNYLVHGASRWPSTRKTLASNPNRSPPTLGVAAAAEELPSPTESPAECAPCVPHTDNEIKMRDSGTFSAILTNSLGSRLLDPAQSLS